jgi:hypothetical protein
MKRIFRPTCRLPLPSLMSAAGGDATRHDGMLARDARGALARYPKVMAVVTSTSMVRIASISCVAFTGLPPTLPDRVRTALAP